MSKIITYQKIKDYIEGEEGNGCKLLMTEEEFELAKIEQNKNNSMVKLKILCGECGKEIFYTSFNKFKNRNKRQCNICSGKELDIGKLIKIHDYQIVKKDKDKYIFKTKEGYLVRASLSQLKNNDKIKPFLNTNPYTLENIKRWMKLQENDAIKNYKLLSIKYIDSREDLSWQCDKNHCFDMHWNSIQQGIRCPYCCENNQKYSIEETINLFKKNNLILLSEDIKDVFERLDCIDQQGYKYKISLKTLIDSQRPIAFASYNPYTIENIRHWLKQYAEDINGYELISTEFKSVAKDKLIWKCPRHGEFYMTWNNFYKKGARCPKCNQSKGEKRIEKLLKKNDFYYNTQHTFNDLKGINNGALKFDFAVFEDEGYSKLLYLIEYQGKQHYEPIEWFGGEEHFKIQQQNDNIKKDYCKKEKLKLIEITYKEFDNIENILIEKINERG